MSDVSFHDNRLLVQFHLHTRQLSTTTTTKMSSLEDLKQIQEQQQYVYRNHGRESLLEKYRIPIHHFDFDYIARATDWKELEQITDVLRSGQEGYYPDLLRVTEDRLRQLKPNSRFLRQTSKVLGKNDLNKDEQDHITDDLQKWVNNVSRNSKELDDRKTNNIRCDVQIRQFDPQPEPLNLVKNKDEKRISSTDYKAWDKYDPDMELMKQDLEEEKMRAEAEKAEKAAEKLKQEAERFVYAGTSSQAQSAGTSSASNSSASTSSANSQFVMGCLDNTRKHLPKKSVRFNQFSTEAEAIFLSDRAMEKGREFFKSGDCELALKCFTDSILCKPTVTNLNNRALTYLRLKKYREALEDCEKVLTVDGKNLKALVRKAQAFEGLKKYEEALDCVDLVIEKDPNNTIAQELAERVRKFCRNVLKNTRMKIVEIE